MLCSRVRLLLKDAGRKLEKPGSTVKMLASKHWILHWLPSWSFESVQCGVWWRLGQALKAYIYILSVSVCCYMFLLLDCMVYDREYVWLGFHIRSKHLSAEIHYICLMNLRIEISKHVIHKKGMHVMGSQVVRSVVSSAQLGLRNVSRSPDEPIPNISGMAYTGVCLRIFWWFCQGWELK